MASFLSRIRKGIFRYIIQPNCIQIEYVNMYYRRRVESRGAPILCECSSVGTNFECYSLINTKYGRVTMKLSNDVTTIIIFDF